MNIFVKHEKRFYVLSVIIFLVGIMSFVYMLVTNINSISKATQEVAMPGTSSVVLDKAGEYTIFYEDESIRNDFGSSSNVQLPDIKCTLINKKDNSPVELTERLHSQYSINGETGYSILKFKIEQPGTYKLSTVYESGSDADGANIVIVRGFMSKILISVLGGIFVLGGSIIISVALIIITYASKRKYKAFGNF